jgi:hypothetical protein
MLLKHVVAIGQASSKLGVLPRSPSLSLFDMLFITGEGLRT